MTPGGLKISPVMLILYEGGMNIGGLESRPRGLCLPLPEPGNSAPHLLSFRETLWGIVWGMKKLKGLAFRLTP
jgi:hypothetical protein